MPELPEVQTVVNGIKSKINKHKILRFKKYISKLRYPIQKNLSSKVESSTVTTVYRRAKYIIINLSNNRSLVIHLGMSGRIIIVKNNKKKFKHTHFSILFDKNLVFQFIDPRRFGYIFVTETASLERHRFFVNLGVEPLIRQFNDRYLLNVTKNKKSPIKNIIMNQKYIVGVGNIYASEALFMSGIHPFRLGKDITKRDCVKLVRAIKSVLKKSIKLGGSSINDHTMVSGKMGYFQNKLYVYGKEGSKCAKRSCQSPIIRIVIAQRSSFYCSECQR
jgi:formamidopyrimidine-DNA glycosylase